MRINAINPFYAIRHQRKAVSPLDTATAIEKIVIGNATLYRANCFDILPELQNIGAVVTDPPYGIGFKYRTYDDAPEKYHGLLTRLIPELVRITNDGPCFVWQSHSMPISGTNTFRKVSASSQLASCIRQGMERGIA